MTTRSTRWPRAASTTTSAAASPATRSTTSGSCPTSRRCSTTRRCSPGATCTRGRSRASPLPTGARRDDRLRAARPAPRRRWLLLGRGRRLRGRRGQVLRVDAARCARRSATTPTRPRSSGTGRHRGRQLRGHQHPASRPSAGRLAACRPDRRRPAGRCSRRREQRVRPGLDDKVLTEWNALLLATLAEAARGHGRARLARRRGRRRPSSCSRDCGGADGRWLRSWQCRRRGPPPRLRRRPRRPRRRLHPPGRGHRRARWIAVACETADAMLDLFWDDEHGGLFTTGHDAERLIARPRTCWTTPRPRPTRWPRSPSCASPPWSPGPATRTVHA